MLGKQKLFMSQNLIISNIADTVGEAAKQGANNALQNFANNDLVTTAIVGAHNGIDQLTSTVTTSFTLPTAPRNLTTTSRPNQVTFTATGSPVSSAMTVSNVSTAARDSNGRVYVFSGPTRPTNLSNYVPPGGNDDASQINLQLLQERPTTGDAFQDALLYGPEALRQRAVVPLAVTIPINTDQVEQGVDDGLVPEASPPPIIYGARVTKEEGGGFRAGRIIEDRSVFGPQGDLARDTIPASVVNAIVGNNPTGSAAWFVRIALALALLLLIIYIVKRVIDEQSKKPVVEQTIVTTNDKDRSVSV